MKFALSMGYLKNIDHPAPGARLGGIVTIEVVRKAEVTSIPNPVNGVVGGPVVLNAGASWTRWIVNQQTALGKRDAASSKEGVSKTNRLSFFIPLDRDEVTAMLDLAENDEFILVCKYPDGTKKIWGTLETPMLFEYSHTTGAQFTDKNGNNCSFYYQGPNNVFFYDAENVIAAGPQPVIVKFNGVAIASLGPGQTLNILSDYSFNDYFTTS